MSDNNPTTEESSAHQSDTPRTDACPHCGAKPMIRSYVCGTTLPNNNGDCYVSELCREREARQKAEAEVEHIKKLVQDPAAVHINMLRGKMAKLSWDACEHILGPHPCRKLAVELVKELISKCDDPIHLEQLKELEK